MSDLLSWGRYPKVKHKLIHEIDCLSDDILPITSFKMLPYGQGRSYGDSCLNENGVLLSNKRLDNFISFDSKNGILRCESGVTLKEILAIGINKGWFLAVTPGTQHVSVGGAIANDVHGKNHHRVGTFGNFVKQFELVRSDGTHLVCSENSNSDLFKATIGGLGLTGLILWAEIQLRKIENPFIDMESIKFKNIDEFFDLSSQSDKSYEYTVSWIDCLSKGSSLGKGIFMRGNHSQKAPDELPKEPKLSPINFPITAPSFLLSKWNIKLFNFFYYNKQLKKKSKALVYYSSFFYPLDNIDNWNRMYGKQGFFQFQCVVPNKAIKPILQAISKSGKGSFLVVLKQFGNIVSPGMLSFPKEGITIALDFPNKESQTLKLLKRLSDMVTEHEGSIYPAKDAIMSSRHFQSFYPKWNEFAKYIDPQFSSSFWRRVTS